MPAWNVCGVRFGNRAGGPRPDLLGSLGERPQDCPRLVCRSELNVADVHVWFPQDRAALTDAEWIPVKALEGE